MGGSNDPFLDVAAAGRNVHLCPRVGSVRVLRRRRRSGSSESASTDAELEIHFDKMYSAFDGQHDFKLPAVVTGVKKVKWSVSDPSIASIETQSDGSAMISVLKVGTVDIIAKAGSVVGKAPLQVTAATKGTSGKEGKERYNNGVVLVRPGSPGRWLRRRRRRPDGGWSEKQGRPEALLHELPQPGGAARAATTSSTRRRRPGGYTDEELVTI